MCFGALKTAFQPGNRRTSHSLRGLLLQEESVSSQTLLHWDVSIFQQYSPPI